MTMPGYKVCLAFFSFIFQKVMANYILVYLKNAGEVLNFTSSDRKKVILVFFALRALQFWEMALFFLLLHVEICL